MDRKKATTQNSHDREFGVFRRYQVIATSLRSRYLHYSGLPLIYTVIWHWSEKAPYEQIESVVARNLVTNGYYKGYLLFNEVLYLCTRSKKLKRLEDVSQDPFAVYSDYFF